MKAASVHMHVHVFVWGKAGGSELSAGPHIHATTPQCHKPRRTLRRACRSRASYGHHVKGVAHPRLCLSVMGNATDVVGAHPPTKELQPPTPTRTPTPQTLAGRSSLDILLNV